MKVRNFIVSFSLLFSCMLTSVEAKAEVDPKLKALGAMAAYGTVGGALLGTASLAFGTKGRSVAIGASLGLYAGLLFGGYVVITHAVKKSRFRQGGDYYPSSPLNSPYENAPPAEPEGNLYPYQNEQSSMWEQYRDLEESSKSVKVALNKKNHPSDTIGFQLINYQF
ncbi:hypothetical protein HBN50_06205 [Halobacteriovorax sp. GB3]|uniref:hypothetical protein n=1 Tax=Halobacteriovorax sp. GB3 TaxID=2719615 RepID=UPI0023608394|nr:hypothetical protein [Halobacteriovorax sp. GB3]MDD0852679.1 hypothetical protein [Halobacteriovorax sp. GB3]